MIVLTFLNKKSCVLLVGHGQRGGLHLQEGEGGALADEGLQLGQGEGDSELSTRLRRTLPWGWDRSHPGHHAEAGVSGNKVFLLFTARWTSQVRKTTSFWILFLHVM